MATKLSSAVDGCQVPARELWRYWTDNQRRAYIQSVVVKNSPSLWVRLSTNSTCGMEYSTCLPQEFHSYQYPHAKDEFTVGGIDTLGQLKPEELMDPPGPLGEVVDAFMRHFNLLFPSEQYERKQYANTVTGLLALDLLQDLETLRRTDFRKAIAKLGFREEDLDAGDLIQYPAKQWLAETVRQEQLSAQIYASIHVDMRIWVMIKDLQHVELPSDHIALLNSLFPPDVCHLANKWIDQEYLKKLRAVFFNIILAILNKNRNPLDDLTSSLSDNLRPKHGWRTTYREITRYLKLVQESTNRFRAVTSFEWHRRKGISQDRRAQNWRSRCHQHQLLQNLFKDQPEPSTTRGEIITSDEVSGKDEKFSMSPESNSCTQDNVLYLGGINVRRRPNFQSPLTLENIQIKAGDVSSTPKPSSNYGDHSSNSTSSRLQPKFQAPLTRKNLRVLSGSFSKIPRSISSVRNRSAASDSTRTWGTENDSFASGTTSPHPQLTSRMPLTAENLSIYLGSVLKTSSPSSSCQASLAPSSASRSLLNSPFPWKANKSKVHFKYSSSTTPHSSQPQHRIHATGPRLNTQVPTTNALIMSQKHTHDQRFARETINKYIAPSHEVGQERRDRPANSILPFGPHKSKQWGALHRATLILSSAARPPNSRSSPPQLTSRSQSRCSRPIRPGKEIEAPLPRSPLLKEWKPSTLASDTGSKPRSIHRIQRVDGKKPSDIEVNKGIRVITKSSPPEEWKGLSSRQPVVRETSSKQFAPKLPSLGVSSFQVSSLKASSLRALSWKASPTEQLSSKLSRSKAPHTKPQLPKESYSRPHISNEAEQASPKLLDARSLQGPKESQTTSEGLLAFTKDIENGNEENVPNSKKTVGFGENLEGNIVVNIRVFEVSATTVKASFQPQPGSKAYKVVKTIPSNISMFGNSSYSQDNHSAGQRHHNKRLIDSEEARHQAAKLGPQGTKGRKCVVVNKEDEARNMNRFRKADGIPQGGQNRKQKEFEKTYEQLTQKEQRHHRQQVAEDREIEHTRTRARRIALAAAIEEIRQKQEFRLEEAIRKFEKDLVTEEVHEALKRTRHHEVSRLGKLEKVEKEAYEPKIVEKVEEERVTQLPQNTAGRGVKEELRAGESMRQSGKPSNLKKKPSRPSIPSISSSSLVAKMSDSWNNPFNSCRESEESVREKNVGKLELKTKKLGSSLNGRMFKAARSSASLNRVSEEDAAKKENEEHKLGGSRSFGNVRARMTKSAKSFSNLRQESKRQ